jgi:hypothetical protein
MVGVGSSSGLVYASGQPAYDHLQTNYFLQRLPNARNDSTVLLASINKRPHEAVSGRFIVWPTLYGRNTGVGNVGFRGVIPAPGKQLAATASTRTKKGMARIAADRDTIKHIRTNGGGYTDPVAMEMQRVLVDVAIDRARQVHNDGSGRIAQLDTVGASSSTVKVNTSIEGAATTRAAGTLDAYFEIGMRVAFCTSAGVFRAIYTGQKYAYVATIAVSGSSVTIGFAPTASTTAVAFDSAPTTGDWVVRCHEELPNTASDADPGMWTDTGFKNEIQGIGGIFSDIGVLDAGTASGSQQSGSYDYSSTATTWFQGIVCSTNPWNQGIVADNGGSGNRAVSEAILQSALSDIERINNAEVNMMLMHNYTYDSLVALGIVDKRFVNTDELTLGHGSLKFNGLKAVKDRFSYQNRVIFLGLSEIEILVTCDIEPLNIGDTADWERVTTNARGDIDQAWRGWGWDDQLCVTGIRNRCGGVVTELNS